MKHNIWRTIGILLVMIATAWASPKAMIIYDASGSMWGQIDGVNKVVIARDALRSVVGQWNPAVELGLTAYGHRVKGDCNDIQTLIPIGRLDKKQMIDTVNAIMPKGMTPIAKSLRQVANSLRQYEDQTTIILISDGRESCDQDPCVTAKQLKREGINFVAHVVGFNVSATTDRQLSCIAKATGGEYFSAKNAAGLTKAIKTIAKKVEKPKPKAITETTLELIARYAMSPKGLSVSGMQWEATQEGKTLYAGDKETPKVPAKVGTVHIKATYSRTSEVQKVEGDVTLKPKKNNPIIIQLKSGRLTIDAAEEQGGPKVKASVHIYPVLDGQPNMGDEIAWCVPTPSKACERVLPIGDFFLTASYNKMKAQRKFSLKNKEKKILHLFFTQTGTVETSASETDGGKWVNASHTVYTPNEEGKPDSHVCSPSSYKKSTGKCKLPTGKYVVRSRYNEFTKLTPIEIKAGETLKFHVVFGSTGQIETSASETDGGKWVNASHTVYTPNEEGKPDSHVCSPSSYKKSTGKCKLPTGKYVVRSRYNEFTKLTPIEIKAGETLKFHVVFGSTGQIETSASETDGGKWVNASHTVYTPNEEGKPDSHVCSPSSYKKSTGKCKLPTGKYVVRSRYNEFTKLTPIEIKAGETLKFHVVFGSTGQIETSASETDGGKWVNASHTVYTPNEEGKPDSHVCSPSSYKKSTGKCKLPTGKYVMRSRYNEFTKLTPIEIKAGETLKFHVVFGSTGQIETSASETDGGKWVNASHTVYTPNEEGKPDSHVCSPSSYKKSTGKCKLPTGKYVVRSRYNEFTKLTPIEIKAGETLKFHVVFGSTGQIETSASETDGGKWVNASHTVYTPNEEGKPDSHVCSPSSYKKSTGKCKLPTGKYVVRSRYNEFTKLTPIEIKAGETLKFHVVFGSTGQIETSASETDGGKWVNASHTVYTPNEEGKPDSHVCSPSSYKKSTGKCKLPTGKYVVRSRYNEFTKLTPIEIKAGETLKFHVVFNPCIFHAQCPKPTSRVHWEIYSSNGQMVADKQIQCTKAWKTTLDDGTYSVEASTDGATAKGKFVVAPGKPDSLTLQLSAPDHASEIQADTPPSKPAAKTQPTAQAQPQNLDQAADKIIKDVTKAANDHKDDIKKVGDLLNALGGLFGNAPKTPEQKKAQAEKKAKQATQNKAADEAFEQAGDDLKMFTD